jgi:hypothetical protein
MLEFPSNGPAIADAVAPMIAKATAGAMTQIRLPIMRASCFVG